MLGSIDLPVVSDVDAQSDLSMESRGTSAWSGASQWSGADGGPAQQDPKRQAWVGRQQFLYRQFEESLALVCPRPILHSDQLAKIYATSSEDHAAYVPLTCPTLSASEDYDSRQQVELFLRYLRYECVTLASLATHIRYALLTDPEDVRTRALLMRPLGNPKRMRGASKLNGGSTPSRATVSRPSRPSLPVKLRSHRTVTR